MIVEEKPLAREDLVRLGRKPRALTIGNFDGVHCGHQALLKALASYAGRAGLTRCAVTFHPHPASIVAPERAPRLLTSLQDRVALLRHFGADEVVVLRFDESLARMDAASFATEILSKSLGARHVVIGDNFRFGNRQAGTATLLRELGGPLNFSVDVVPLAHWRGLPVSSSEIRRLLLAGNVTGAARLLGRPHALKGPIVQGRGVGSKQTVPTLNLGAVAEVVPANGVYVTRAYNAEHGIAYPSITNVGVRPTFEDGHPERSIETFLLGPLLAEPVHIELQFLHWIRAERKFGSPDLLRAQILRDAARAQAFHRRILKWHPEEYRPRERMGRERQG
ncbi:MAG: riboflavin biosynthesis protein RibF [Bryobacterales bacterium]|nr:riboflavin biosynthesis protein RibF [Bryobacterales bacterium]